MGYGVGVGAAVVVALIAAAVSATAVTATKAATGQIDGVGDGLEEWFKTFGISAGIGVAGSYAGTAVQGAGTAAEIGQTAAEAAQATKIAVDAGQAAQLVGSATQVGTTAAQAAKTGVDAGVGVTSGLSGMDQAIATAADAAPLAQTSFDAVPAVGLSAANTTGQNAPTLWQSVFEDNGVVKTVYDQLGGNTGQVDEIIGNTYPKV